jgi:putative nucleotidyltransferase with HDIG domain
LSAALPKVRVPIRTKIILPYLFLAVLLAAGIGYVITRIVFDSLEERYNNQLIEGGKLAAEWMYREEERMLASLRLMANASGMAQAVQARQAESARELAYGIAVDNQEEAVEILDAQGYLLLSMRHRPGGRIEEYEFAKDGDQSFLQWEFVEKVVNRQSDGYGDKYSGLVRSTSGDIFYIAAPILDAAGAQAGTLLVGKRLETIAQQIRAETLAQVSLYDFDGAVLVSTFSAPVKLPAVLVSQVLGNQDQSSLSRNLRDLQVTNISYQEIVGPWEIRDDSDVGLLGIALPRTFYVSATRVTRTQIILLLAAAILLVVALGLSLSRVITQPILNLVHASTRIASGDFEVQLQPRSNDEVAVLTTAFNEMVEDLQTSRNALLLAYDSTLEGWSKALELRDKETEGHTLRVAKMAVELARKLGVEGEALLHLQRGALLHDIGKMGVPDQILLKPGKLTDEEWVIMRKHCEYAFDLLWPIEYLRPAVDIPFSHHERWDGKGYPRGLRGTEIPLSARIFSIIDVWDALRSDRPYKKAFGYAESVAIIRSAAGTQFDPQVAEAFLEMVEQLAEAEMTR